MLKFLLYPFSWLYGVVIAVRNFLFDKGLLPSKEFHTPVISVGNLAVGWNRKTPHSEYLIRLLQASYRVALLSRVIAAQRKVLFWRMRLQMRKQSAMNLIKFIESFHK